ncbi:MAG: DUF4301 family protein [Muribaculaceae bacterium]|nr:DUF4301 family protein [Muribaculaceae bacterium]
MFTENDIKQMAGHGIGVATAEAQMKRFSTGFPYLTLRGSATVDAGIKKLDSHEQELAVARWKKYLEDGGEVAKFVPASGAASRMFKALFEFVNGDSDVAPEGKPVAELVAHLDQLPFLPELTEATVRLYGKTPAELKSEGQLRKLIGAIILPDGLNYGALPKAMLTFHRYADGSTRTPLQEHLVEGAQTAASHGVVNLHFTVSADHRRLFEEKIKAVVPEMEKRYGIKYNISLSEQKPSTDTLAATPDGQPFRDSAGNLVFRPGGHGALIANLGDMDSAVVFIKNIDNVVPDSRRDSTVQFKQVLAGELILAHDRIEKYLFTLREGLYDRAALDEIVKFLRNTLCIDTPLFDSLSDVELAELLIAKLDRPLRVCGMVRNDGEPGGGPFLAVNPDGSSSPQILESTQIDMTDPASKEMLEKATHFNPVDLVCYIKRPDGSRYELEKYVDPDTGFISSKSFEGRELRALELPGLWNGAMSDWNTIFVEVPSSTFNPVKTVNDLLRPAHQE